MLLKISQVLDESSRRECGAPAQLSQGNWSAKSVPGSLDSSPSAWLWLELCSKKEEEDDNNNNSNEHCNCNAEQLERFLVSPQLAAFRLHLLESLERANELTGESAGRDCNRRVPDV